MPNADNLSLSAEKISSLHRTKEFEMLISKKTRRCTVAVAATALIRNGLLLSSTLCFGLPLQIHGFGDSSVLSSRTGIVPYGRSFIRKAASSSIVKSRSRCSHASSDTTLSMHMGHSHSHHHHHDHSPDTNKSTTPAAGKPPPN